MLVAFDINETLLDLGVLDEPFRETFGSDAVRRAWFVCELYPSPGSRLLDARLPTPPRRSSKRSSTSPAFVTSSTRSTRPTPYSN